MSDNNVHDDNWPFLMIAQQADQISLLAHRMEYYSHVIEELERKREVDLEDFKQRLADKSVQIEDLMCKLGAKERARLLRKISTAKSRKR